MNAVVIEHVPVAELPLAWRERLGDAAAATVTIRIEEDVLATSAETFVTDDPAFGIWRDRDDVADVPAHMQKIRQGRYNLDGSGNET